MAGPQDWGAVPNDTPEDPTAWGAKPVPEASTALAPENTFASFQFAKEYAHRAYQEGNYGRFLAGGAGALIAGGVETIGSFFKTSHKALNEGVTPEEETEFGLNVAMLELGVERPFLRPSIKPTAAAIAPTVAEFDDKVVAPSASRIDAFVRAGDPNGVRLEPPLPQTQPSPIRPIEGSPFAGVPRSVAARTDIPEVNLVLDHPTTKAAIDNAVIDRSHDVPYMAGGSVPLEDPTVYIDRHVPKEQTVSGVTFDPAEPWAVHENVEQTTMDIFLKHGMTPEEAYRVAHFDFAEPAEQAWYRAHGIDQVAAEAEQQKWLPKIQHENPENPPPNLYDKPYPHESVAGAEHEGIAETPPTPEESARGRDIIRNESDLQPRSAIPMLSEARALGVIGPTPPLDESPAVKAQRAIPAQGPPQDKITMTPAGEPIDAWESRFKDWVKRLDSPDDIKPFILESAAKNNNFPEARAGTIAPEHIEALAESAGIDPATIQRAKLATELDNPDRVRMAKQMLDQLASDYRDAAAKVELEPSPANIAEMLQSEIRRDYATEWALGLRAEWGRTGHALRDLLDAVKGAPTTGLGKELAGALEKEKAPIAPKSITDVVDRAREFSKKAAKGEEGPLGLDSLVKAAADLVDQAKPKKPGAPKPKLPDDVAELVKTAQAVVNLMNYERPGAEPVPTVRPLRKLLPGEEAPAQVSPLAKFNALVTEAEKNVTAAVKEGKTVKGAMPDALASMIGAAENVTSHFGGVGINRAVADLLARKGRTPEDMATMARSMRGLSNEQAARILSDMRGKQQPWYYWYWQQGLLSGEVTHTKYVTVNFGFTTLDRVIAPQVASMIGALHGGEKVFFAEPFVAMYSLTRGVPDALRGSLAAFRSGMRMPTAEELQLADRYLARGEKIPKDLLHTQPVPYGQPGAPDWGIWQRVFNDKQLGVAEKVIGFPGRSASAIHTFYKILGVAASKGARAYREAAKEISDPLSNEFNERYAYHYANPTDENMRGAITDGYSGTFMDKLGPLEQRLASYIKDTKWKWAFPFMHIPINIVRQTIRYSPAAWLNESMRADLMGRNGNVAQDLAIAKMTVGSSVMGYFFNKAMMGEMTGDYPTDPKERNEWKVMGKIPNAVSFNGQWIQLQRFGPIGNLAAIGGDIGSILRHEIDAKDETINEKMGNAVGHSIMASANFLANETGFLTMRNLFDVMEGKQSMAQWAAYQAGTLIPFSSFARQTASFFDPNMREAKTLIDGIKAQLPGLRESILPKRDPLYGEPVANPGYHTPFRGVPVQSDPVKTELDRLKYFPTAPQKDIGHVKLTSEQYDRYEATAGQLVKELLSREINRPGYANMPDSVKQERLKELVQFARGKARVAIQHYYPELIQQGIEARRKTIGAPSPAIPAAAEQ